MNHDFHRSVTYKVGPHPMDGQDKELANTYITIVSHATIRMDIDTGAITETTGTGIKRLMAVSGKAGPDMAATLDALTYAAKKLIVSGMPAYTNEKDETGKFKPSVAQMLAGYHAQWANVRFPRRGGEPIVSHPDMLAAVLKDYTIKAGAGEQATLSPGGAGAAGETAPAPATTTEG